MARPRPSSIATDLHAIFHAGVVAGLTDGQLLERFVARDGLEAERAFEALVTRHARLVQGVCRGLLRDEQAAEDAFQATFVVLIRRAGSLWIQDSLGPWLYAVARRVAKRARAELSRRQASEVRRVEPAVVPPDDDGFDVHAALHEEIGRLPGAYRKTVVLCYLEGRTCEETARHLRCPVGTVKTRLSRARERLRRGMSRRGMAPSVVAISGLLTREANASPPSIAIQSLVQKLLGGSSLSARVTALAVAVRRELVFAALKPAAVALLVVVTVGSGFLLASRADHWAQVRPRPAARSQKERSRPTSPAPFRVLNLRAQANRRLTDDLGGISENNLISLPRGERTLSGIPFAIGDAMIHLAGDGAPGNQGDRGPKLPRTVAGITVGAQIGKLHVLHAVHFDGKKDGVLDGTEVASLVVRYADGSAERVPIVYGEDVRDWWYDPAQPGRTRAAVAWTGTNPPARENRQDIRLFAMTWANPHPDRLVSSIDLETAGTRAELLLVAATAESP